MSGNCELLVDTVGGWILDGEQRKVNALPGVHSMLSTIAMRCMNH